MRTLKPLLGVIVALVPIVYCVGLLYHFVDLSGSVQEANEIGLGPTLLGLGIVGLLFCIPLIIRIARLFSGPRAPGSGPDARDDDGGRDADAMIARYMAQRPAEAVSKAPAAPRAQGGGPAKRSGFGRRTS